MPTLLCCTPPAHGSVGSAPKDSHISNCLREGVRARSDVVAVLVFSLHEQGRRLSRHDVGEFTIGFRRADLGDGGVDLEDERRAAPTAPEKEICNE